MSLPDRLCANLFDGVHLNVGGALAAKPVGWLTRTATRAIGRKMKPSAPADLADWTHPDVGWSLVLPMPPGQVAVDSNNPAALAALATADDQPPAIRRLWEARGKPPLFRYEQRPGSRTLLWKPAVGAPVSLLQADRGLDGAKVPFYLLIVGGPDRVDWEFQMQLNEIRAVGRLALEGVELERYVDALIANWDHAGTTPRKPVVWSVDHGPADITCLMRKSIAEPLVEKFAGDNDLKEHLYVDGSKVPATRDLLKQALTRKPSVVVTTSHGQAGPAADPAAIRQKLGWLVDANSVAMDPATITADWDPDGVIWYAHACCGAGATTPSHFAPLFESGSDLRTSLEAVAGIGPAIAPFPQALLGAAKPARAFIGHVEPTFDWTLRHVENRQYLTGNLVSALYTELFRSQPVGLALRRFFAGLDGALGSVESLTDDYNLGRDVRDQLLFVQLMARDIRSLVILGDPTVRIPEL